MHRQSYRKQLSFIAAVVVLTCIGAVTQAQDYQVFDLGAISPTKDSTGFAVNDLGQVVGQSAADELSAPVTCVSLDGRRDDGLGTITRKLTQHCDGN